MKLKIVFVLAFSGIIFNIGLVKIGHPLQGLNVRQTDRQTDRKLVPGVHISLIKHGEIIFSFALMCLVLLIYVDANINKYCIQ